ncbi:hypothetical protein [Azohydromonas aeria]|uniref:hypothetical protein n=1 Tax=Azohydromonas aeria TaxID=2590212 RepID=UPI0012FCFD93|nr:hypothetical protein [Azohydromonas aeria]
MDVKTVVAQAKHQIADLFADEAIENLGLEEVDYDESKGVWSVTLGFSRPWDQPRGALAAIAGQNLYAKRAFKVVQIEDATSKVLSVRNRDVPA